MTRILNDFLILNLFRNLAKCFGHFPLIKNKLNSKYQFKVFSWSALWFSILLLHHIICFQNSYLQINYEMVNANKYSNSTTMQDALAMSKVFMAVHNYTVCIAWWFSLKRFSSCWEKLYNYDETFGKPKFERNGKQLISYLIPWGLAGFMDLFTKPYMVIKFRATQTQFSWLQAVFKLDPVTTAIIVGIDSFIVGSAAFIATSLISFTSKLIYCRIDDLRGNIDLITNKKPEGQNFIPTKYLGKILVVPFDNKNDNENSSQTKVSFQQQQEAEELQDVLISCTAKLERLDEIYQKLRSASKYIIFLIMTFGTIILALLTFMIIRTYSILSYRFVLLGMIGSLINIMWRMMHLCNAGESLQESVKKLRLSVMKIVIMEPSNDGDTKTLKLYHANQHKLQHLKFFISNLDFELSGCGFFNVSRKSMTSIVSVILTYNVVLAQFYNNDNNGESSQKQ